MPPTDRGQSFAYVVAGGTIIIAAGVIAVFQSPVDDLLTKAGENCISDACNNGVSWVGSAWEWAPLWVSGMVLVLILAAAIWESRSPGL